MREVQVVTWCDGEHLDRVRATVERREGITGEPVLLDLCSPCDVKFEKDLDVIREWLARGVPVAKASTVGTVLGGKTRTVQCPRCEFASVSRGGLGHHLKKQHDLTLKQAGL